MKTTSKQAEHVSGAENGAERAESQVCGSGAVSGHSRQRLAGAGPEGRGARAWWTAG